MNFADFGETSFYQDPYPLYEQLRAQGPLVSLLPTMWISGHYRVADELLRDRHMGKDFMGYVRNRYEQEVAEGEVFQLFDQSILMMNPPDHTHLRSLLMKAFNSRHMDEFTGLSEMAADQLIDQFYRAGEVDLVSQYAHKLPIMVICHLLGLDDADTHLFTTELIRLTQAVTKALDVASLSGKDLDSANAATRRLREFFREKLRQRRHSPGQDLISLLLHLEEQGTRMSDEQIVANIIFLFAAGHETTSNMIGNTLVTLFRHPEALARVRNDMTLLPGCILECVRYDSSVQIAAREVTEDFVFEGHALHRGDTVVICLGAVNRDPRKFVDPDTFLIDRPGLNAREVASFGGGPHYCLGARLALVEIAAAVRALFHRLPDMELTNLQALHWHPANTIRGVQALQARWNVPS